MAKANREQGEASFTLGEKSYRLVFNAFAFALAQNAIAEFQQGRVPSVEEIGQRIDAQSQLYSAATFWAICQKYHPEVRDVAMAIDIMTQSGGEAAKAMVRAINAAAPDRADTQELEGAAGAANPPQAQAPGGTGDASTSPLAQPA